MPIYRNDDGREVSASADSFLERRLLRDGWKTVPESAPVDPPSPDPKPDLSGKTRAELNEIAASMGVVDPESLPNIAAVKEAIEAA